MAAANMSLSTRVVASYRKDTLRAWEEVQSLLADFPAEVLILFCSADHALDTLADQIVRTGHTVLACTSGESTTSLQVMALHGENLALRLFSIPHLSAGPTSAQPAIEAIVEAAQHSPNGQQRVGLLLVDGLSRAEEWLAHALYTRLPGVPFLGGSAGDNFQFERTAVYWQGAFHTDMAVFGLFEPHSDFSLFQSELAGGRGEPMVITLADVQRRAILQLNGLPAAEVYAAALGVREDELTPAIWRQHPLMVKVGNDQVARAISHIASDGALVCLSAVDSGLIATLGEAASQPTDIQAVIQRAQQSVTNVAGLVLIDCALNARSETATATEPEVPALILRSFGEQFNGQHRNASVAALVLGASP